MIGMRTILEVADNSGARRLACILPRGGDLGLRAGLGDVVTASVKEAAPESAVESPGEAAAASPVETSPIAGAPAEEAAAETPEPAQESPAAEPASKKEA